MLSQSVYQRSIRRSRCWTLGFLHGVTPGIIHTCISGLIQYIWSQFRDKKGSTIGRRILSADRSSFPRYRWGTSRGVYSQDRYHCLMNHLDVQNTRWIDPPARWAGIASRMGVTLNRCGIVPNFLNAATDLRGTVFIGEPLLKMLSFEDVEAILAHELAHATWFRTQAFQRTVLLAAMIWHEFSMKLRRIHPLLALMCWQELGLILHWMLAPCRWSRECSADTVAAEVVGKERMQAALANLRQLRGFPDLPSLDHPPLDFRIARL